MLNALLKDYQLILASASPRRHAFLKELDIPFKIQLQPVEEIYPNEYKQEEITNYLAQLKAEPFIKDLQSKDILLTSDTIVWHNHQALGKPKDQHEARYMLKQLSNASHSVITSICLTTISNQIVKHTSTKVTFKTLTSEEINYYIKHFQPFDKAGAYGIQEWIGSIGITKIEGSYNNVVGLPTHLLYETLKAMV